MRSTTLASVIRTENHISVFPGLTTKPNIALFSCFYEVGFSLVKFFSVLGWVLVVLGP